jgi:hypothetical protein
VGLSGPVFGDIAILSIAPATERLRDRMVLGRTTACYSFRTSYTAELCIDENGIPLFLNSRAPDGQAMIMEATAVRMSAPPAFVDALVGVGNTTVMQREMLDLPPLSETPSNP